MKVTLGSVASYINGFAFKPTDWSTCGLKIIRIQNLTNPTSEANYYSGTYDLKYEVNRGDVLISWSASLGIYIWQDEKAVLNQHIFKVVFDKVSLNKKYFFYQVSYILKRAESETHGATMKHLTRPVFNALPFELPSMEQQNFIANELDIIARLINAHKRQLHLLDELVKSRFVEMFGGIHNSSLYPYVTIECFTTVISGGTPNRGISEYWQDGRIRWVKSTELHNCVITDTEEKITQLGMSNSSAKLIPADSVLIAMYGQGKTRGMTGYLAVTCTTNQACACILPSPTVNQKYLWQYMILSYDKLRNMAKGGNQPNLNVGIIKKFPVLMPPLELQEQFAAFVSQIDKSRLAIQKSLDEAQLLFDSLMQKYFG